MKKAQNRMEASRPYSEKITTVIGHLANAHPEFEHLLYEKSRGTLNVLESLLFQATGVYVAV